MINLRRVSLYFSLLVLVACVNENTNDSKASKAVAKTIKAAPTKPTKSNKPIIYIAPLGNVPADYVNFVKQSIIDFYHYQVVIKPRQSLSSDLKNSAQGRYVADKILSKFNSNKNTLVLTTVDIVTNNEQRGIKEWGVFGLGYRPGTTCVVSTFRLNKGKVKVSNEKFLERLKKICIHEIGHNLGLEHCTNNKVCLMNDARGLISQVDMETLDFCNVCKKKIGMKD